MKNKPKSRVSVAIITQNSQKYIKEVLNSTMFADEVIIVDGYSRDKTVQIAKSFSNVKIFHSSWCGYAKQKQKAVDFSSNEWVFILDSDEVISSTLKEQIIKILKNPTVNGYMVSRLNYFFSFKKPMKFGGFYPDCSLRLFNKKFGHYSDDAVHERVLVCGETKHIKGDIIHYAYEDISSFITKQNTYSSLLPKNSRVKAIFAPIWIFLRIYIFRLGFLDGWRGFVVARLYAQYTFWKYIKDTHF